MSLIYDPQAAAQRAVAIITAWQAGMDDEAIEMIHALDRDGGAAVTIVLATLLIDVLALLDAHTTDSGRLVGEAFLTTFALKATSLRTE